MIYNDIRMPADGPHTVPIYSRSVSVDAPTRAILSGHGLGDPCPAEFKLRVHVYKKIVVSAGLVTSEEEEAWCLSAHVALALLRDIPLLQSHDTNRYIDLGYTDAALVLDASTRMVWPVPLATA